MSEPWNTLLFVIVIPFVHQAIKFYRDRSGNTLSKEANQVLSLILASVFLFVSGGVAGLEFPAFPALPSFMGDAPAIGQSIIDFLANVATFLGSLASVIGLGWGALMALYETVYERLFTKINLGTADKYAEIVE